MESIYRIFGTTVHVISFQFKSISKLYLTRALSRRFENYREQVERASTSARGIQTLYCCGMGYLKGNISTLVTGNDSRNLSAECRLAVGAGHADLQRILNENIETASLSLPRIHLIFAQIDIAKELSAAPNQLSSFPSFTFSRSRTPSPCRDGFSSKLNET